MDKILEEMRLAISVYATSRDNDVKDKIFALFEEFPKLKFVIKIGHIRDLLSEMIAIDSSIGIMTGDMEKAGQDPMTQMMAGVQQMMGGMAEKMKGAMGGLQGQAINPKMEQVTQMADEAAQIMQGQYNVLKKSALSIAQAIKKVSEVTEKDELLVARDMPIAIMKARFESKEQAIEEISKELEMQIAMLSMNAQSMSMIGGNLLGGEEVKKLLEIQMEYNNKMVNAVWGE